MASAWWYLCRASGLVATVLAVASLVLGLFFSARNTGVRRSPAWWLDLHNYLGGLALAFTGLHIAAAVFDPGSGVGLAQALVPGAAAWAIGWGVLAAYSFALAVFTSWPKRRFSRRVWRVLHVTSVAGVAAAGLHAYQLGSEAGEALFQLGLVVAVALAVYAVALRVIGVRLRTRAGAR